MVALVASAGQLDQRHRFRRGAVSRADQVQTPCRGAVVERRAVCDRLVRVAGPLRGDRRLARRNGGPAGRRATTIHHRAPVAREPRGEGCGRGRTTAACSATTAYQAGGQAAQQRRNSHRPIVCPTVEGDEVGGRFRRGGRAPQREWSA